MLCRLSLNCKVIIAILYVVRLVLSDSQEDGDPELLNIDGYFAHCTYYLIFFPPKKTPSTCFCSSASFIILLTIVAAPVKKFAVPCTRESRLPARCQP